MWEKWSLKQIHDFSIVFSEMVIQIVGLFISKEFSLPTQCKFEWEIVLFQTKDLYSRRIRISYFLAWQGFMLQQSKN
jgi:hypothetical protein